jgi:hypothetical protein
VSPAQWFIDHLANVADVLKYKPSGEPAAKAVLDFEVTLHRISKCEVCSRDAAGYLTDLAEKLKRDIDDYNNQVMVIIALLNSRHPR